MRMPETREITALLELERDEERFFVEHLTAAERAARGTPERPAPKDFFAHAIAGKHQMHEALVAARTEGTPSASHDRDEVFEAHAGRSFESIEHEAERVGQALFREVDALDATTLGSAPPWISEDTLADEIVQQCVTHALVHLFEPLCARGDTDEALRTQMRFVDALPDDTGTLQRSRALYNLGCLYLRAGRADDAVTSITQAARLRPSLIEHARSDPELEPIKSRLADLG
jgi:hypothetical protein